MISKNIFMKSLILNQINQNQTMIWLVNKLFEH